MCLHFAEVATPPDHRPSDQPARGLVESARNKVLQFIEHKSMPLRTRGRAVAFDFPPHMVRSVTWVGDISLRHLRRARGGKQPDVSIARAHKLIETTISAK
jgi:hypothetical protein